MKRWERTKADSRCLLPVEMLVGWLMLAWSTIGWLGLGPLHDNLVKTQQDDAWGVLFSICGSSMVFVSLCQWWVGHNWEDKKIMRASGVRCVIAFVSTSCLFSMSWQVFEFQHWHGLPWGMCSFGAGMISAWSFKENLKVKLVQDDDVDTRDLLFHR